MAWFLDPRTPRATIAALALTLVATAPARAADDDDSATPACEDGVAGYPVDGTDDCVDDDGDGHAEIQGDCDDGDPAVYRDAPEICDDKVDNDCDGAIDFEDHDCLAQAEEGSGLILACDFPDPPEATAVRGAPWALPLAGLLLRVRRGGRRGGRRGDPRAQ